MVRDACRAAFRLAAVIAVAGCGSAAEGNASAGTGTEIHGQTNGSSGGSEAQDGGQALDADSSGESGNVKFDVDPGTGDRNPAQCKIHGDMDAVGACQTSAPPNSFDPEVQWSWAGADGKLSAVAVPLVINLTDDNGDGEIDLCDIPDVVVTVFEGYGPQDFGSMWVLDGATGEPHFRVEQDVSALGNAAVGDIDGDGLPEIVATQPGSSAYNNRLVAFENDGALKWQSDKVLTARQQPIALYDLDADGDVEILIGDAVFDHNGSLVVEFGFEWLLQSPTAADLDDDGDLEVVLGASAFHHDGAPYYETGLDKEAIPHIADLDGDGLPEVLLTGPREVSLLEHDGTPIYTEQLGNISGVRGPAAIHDVDGDGSPEFLNSSGSTYWAYRPDLTPLWSAPILDHSGAAAGTAFDFLGTGAAQAMYADEYQLHVFGADGEVLFQTPRMSWTQLEYPVVADIDNDGSAEILVVSSFHAWLEDQGVPRAPPIQAIRDVEDRWVPARRIWNQHAYHVTNVREDGTIPMNMPKNWELLNTFRTQAQSEGGTVCQPEPEG